MEKHKFASISLTVRDRAISSKYSTLRVSKKCTIGSFRPPSSILSEIKNVGYLEILYRQSDFEQTLNQCKGHEAEYNLHVY